MYLELIAGGVWSKLTWTDQKGWLVTLEGSCDPTRFNRHIFIDGHSKSIYFSELCDILLMGPTEAYRVFNS